MTKRPIFNAAKFGERLRVALARRNISVRDAAKEIGISHATVSRTSAGKIPNIENYLRITVWLEKNERRAA
ncbi:MAG: helix-turn-helix transcriptional regulator [Patescibacteria group bacterium]|nr:helix-turn-helix transcriptional regulator [Patescibacteria group bacterium]